MLILTRRIGESVYIGDEVRLTVLGVRGMQVRLGINAPKDIPVHREEIYHKIKHSQAAGGQPGAGYGDADGNTAPYPRSTGGVAEPGNVAEPRNEQPLPDDDAIDDDAPDPNNS